MTNISSVTNTGIKIYDTSGLLSLALGLISFGRYVVQYEREKVLVPHIIFEGDDYFQPLPNMEGGNEVYWKVRNRQIIDNPRRKK